MRSALLAAIVPAVLVPGVAQAAPRHTTDVLGTYGFGRAAVIGSAGEAAGLWSTTMIYSGIAGDDLVITYTPRYKASATERVVYTALFTEVAYPDAECDRVGADGVAKHVWVSYRCRTGVAPNYTLLVR
ncbi:hypothetical protein GCM10010168_57420 [Actinoplanes ianthinogenes]|uniref:Secreted protein n=1 Tax=Actinoplanes ianthinogenes TaxID=122358 RepID=A0ABM7M2L9_9ACTN|nr:hypothetical protein [Actinoplanes ianthinogenes]BCJ45838.1 hypothetical protein Aiant_64950 [Actinoplanes ianthinogenes]GGR31674.1 hypothetical protein GCM10010168_57420 [Actinoplanes ianthinogenes]